MAAGNIDMIDRQHGNICFECDTGCGAVLATEHNDFTDAVKEFRRDGWQSRKIGRDWKHLCPDCTGGRFYAFHRGND